MAEAKSDMLPFAADALHTNALAAPNDAALKEGGADYYGLHQVILELGRSILTPGSRVLDLHCDLRTLMPLVMEHEDLCKFVVLSPTEERNWICFDRLRTRVKLGFVDAAHLSLQDGFPEIYARLMLSLNALGDLTISRRVEVLESMHRRLERDGAAVVMEMVETEGDRVQSHRAFGHPVFRKRRSWSAAEWESALIAAGFGNVTKIWSDERRVAWLVRK